MKPTPSEFSVRERFPEAWAEPWPNGEWLIWDRQAEPGSASLRRTLLGCRDTEAAAWDDAWRWLELI